MTPSARVGSTGGSSRTRPQDSLIRHRTSALILTLPALILAVESLAAAPGPPEDNPGESRSSAQALKKLSIEELLNIEVTSVSKRPQKLAEAAAAINVITGDEIERSGASSFPEALRLADNLTIAQGTSASWSISARGFNAAVSNKLLVLIDGRSVYTPLFSGVIWNMQDYLLTDIDRIEVISGPGGTLWGANAVNGVINIISKNAKDTQGLYLETGGGFESQDSVGVRYGGMLASNVFLRAYGKYFDRAAEVLADGSSASDSWNRVQGGFRIDSDASEHNKLTLQGDVYTGNTNVQSDDKGKAGGGNLLGRWTHSVSEDTDTTLQLYYDRTHLVAPFPASGAIPAGNLTDDLDTYDVDFQSRFRWGERQRLVWGLGYRFTHDALENAPTVAFVPAHLDHGLFNAFVQDEIKLREKVFFTFGTKLEHNDYTGYEIEPSGRLQWNLTSARMIWAAVSRAVRMPARYDRDLYEPNPIYGVFLSGNSSFRSETVVAYEIGYRGQLGPKVSGSLSAYYNDYEHVRSLGLTPVTFLPVLFQNNLLVDSYGFELSADYQASDWWRLHAGYSLIKEDVRVAPGEVDLFNGLNETADPEQQVFVRSSMDFAHRTRCDVAFRWIDTVHNNSGPTPGTVPSYADVDIRVAWYATKNLEISIVGRNLLHDHHPEAGFPEPNREEVARSAYGKLALRF
jgi:iron complex outermembrane receptor protein